MRARAARSAANPMDVLAGIIGRVKLDDPVDRRDIEAARRDVGAEQGARALRTELKKRRGSLLLLLTAVDINHWDIDVVEKLRMKLDRIARRKEHLRRSGEHSFNPTRTPHVQRRSARAAP